MSAQFDLLISNGRLVDPGQGIDSIRDIAIKDGKVAALGEKISPDQSKEVIHATGKVVTPGLIDLHTHVFKGLHICLDADEVGARSGVTTMVDTGSAGSANFALFRDHIISKAKTRIVPFINIWITGASMMSLSYGEMAKGEYISSAPKKDPGLSYFDSVRYASVEETTRAIDQNRSLIYGVKVWINRFVAKGSIEPLHHAKQVAMNMGLPVMVCTYFGPPWMKNILPFLEAGDIQTHFYGIFTGLVNKAGKILPAAIDARERGVTFDVGHGAASFDFGVAEQAIAQGFTPDTISTDLWVACINGPVYDLPMTMAKFMMLGMSLPDVIRATTARPAEILKLQNQIGSLRVGMEADVAIFDLVDGEFDLEDTQGIHRTANQRLVCNKTIRAGEVLN